MPKTTKHKRRRPCKIIKDDLDDAIARLQKMQQGLAPTSPLVKQCKDIATRVGAAQQYIKEHDFQPMDQDSVPKRRR